MGLGLEGGQIRSEVPATGILDHETLPFDSTERRDGDGTFTRSAPLLTTSNGFHEEEENGYTRLT